MVAMFGAAKAVVTDNTSSAYGIALTANASNNVKGAYSQLVASTPQDAYGLLIQIQGSSTGDHLIDIAIGAAASEQIIAANIVHARQIGNTRRGSYALIPGFIPSGTRLSAREQCSTGGANALIAIILLPAIGPFSLANLTRMTNYGGNTTTSGGVSIQPGGTINTKGAYSQISSSTTNPMRWAVLMFGNQANAARANTANNSWTVDVAIGSAGNETIIVPDVFIGAGAADSVVVPILVSIPTNIPSGTRVAVRAQCTINDATDRTFDFSMLGAD